MRQLNFFQVVDSHWIVVAGAREKDFNKISHNAKLCRLKSGVLGMLRDFLVRSCFRLSAGNVVRLPDTFGNFRDWELIETVAHVAAGIAILQPPCED